MKRLLIILPILLVICGSSAAQEITPSPTCPTIWVTGPAGATHPGDTAVFTVQVSGISSDKLSFSWLISSGTIISGQDTESITVQLVPDSEFSTATVEVRGLPPGCKATASETAATAPSCGLPIMLDEFGKLSLREERLRLDNAVQELGNYSSGHKLYFIVHKGSRESARSVEARIIRYRRHLLEIRKISPDLIHFTASEAESERTLVYVVSADAMKSFR